MCVSEQKYANKPGIRARLMHRNSLRREIPKKVKKVKKVRGKKNRVKLTDLCRDVQRSGAVLLDQCAIELRHHALERLDLWVAVGNEKCHKLKTKHPELK